MKTTFEAAIRLQGPDTVANLYYAQHAGFWLSVAERNAADAAKVTISFAGRAQVLRLRQQIDKAVETSRRLEAMEKGEAVPAALADPLDTLRDIGALAAPHDPDDTAWFDATMAKIAQLVRAALPQP